MLWMSQPLHIPAHLWTIQLGSPECTHLHKWGTKEVLLRFRCPLQWLMWWCPRCCRTSLDKLCAPTASRLWWPRLSTRQDSWPGSSAVDWPYLGVSSAAVFPSALIPVKMWSTAVHPARRPSTYTRGYNMSDCILCEREGYFTAYVSVVIICLVLQAYFLY